MNKFMQLGAALGGAALVVAAGSAYTNSTTVPSSIAGYGTATVTGGPALNSVVHTLDASGDITGSTLEFATTMADRTIAAGFTATTLEDCALIVTTTVTCTYAAPVDNATATNFFVAVS